MCLTIIIIIIIIIIIDIATEIVAGQRKYIFKKSNYTKTLKK